MPSSEEIVAGLTEIANDAFGIAVAWHVAIAVALMAFVAGWRPSRRLAGLVLSLPAASVAILAFAYGNPFNGTVFAGVSIALAVLALRLDAGPVAPGPAWALVLGAAMIAFGWLYPHFLEGRSATAYLYGAPTGLVPCPTLSLTIGAALALGGLESRAWSLTLGAAGVFYGLFGAARLGVGIDLALLAGAGALLVLVLWPRARGMNRGAAHAAT